jgi:D-inositol-3-phosphate glycosyltransferase
MINKERLSICMLSVHSSPLGKLGSQDTGGMSVYVRELSRELGRAGHRVDIFTRGGNNDLQRVVPLSENARLIHLDVGENGMASKNEIYPLLPLFYDRLESFRSKEGSSYDIIHSHYWLSGCAGSMAQKFWKVPHVVMFHTTGLAKMHNCSEENEPEVRLVAEKKLARECSMIFAPTDKEKGLLSGLFSVSERKISVVPCGVNLGTFNPLPKNWARKRLALDILGPLILYVGRFAPVKGIERLLSAITDLNEYNGLELIIAGGDNLTSESSARLRQDARKLGIEKKVIFTGRIDHQDLPLFYSAADVLVVPSYYESFSLVTLESLACGTPVVATPVGAVPSLIKNGRTGEVVDPPNAQGIASAIAKVLKGHEAGLFPAEEIRSSVEGYDWPHISSSVIHEYYKLLSVNSHRHENRKVADGIRG